MKYKMMAVDMDGTLLSSSNTISKDTRNAIRKAVASGLVFSISTGRPLKSILPYLDELGLDLPLIIYQGAKVLMGRSGEVIYERRLSAGDAGKIITLGKKFDTTVCVWIDSDLYVNVVNDRVRKYVEMNGTVPKVFNDPEPLIKEGVSKILWNDDVENINRYERELAGLLDADVNYHTSQPFLLEFVDKKASKAISMAKLGAHFGFAREEMIAVGDGFNDLSMITYAGLGVAMANAPEAIREKADFITLSNDEDGVAHVIHKFILNTDKSGMRKSCCNIRRS